MEIEILFIVKKHIFQEIQVKMEIQRKPSR